MMTWSNTWLSNNDSIWSIIMKFKLANTINFDFVRKNYLILENKMDSDEYLKIILPTNFDYIKISKHLDFDVLNYFKKQIEELGLNNIDLKGLKLLFSQQLKYCPCCIKYGFHSNLHQLKHIHYCPFHKQIPLLNKCRKCESTINFFSSLLYKAPYSCKCGYKLVSDYSLSDLQKYWRRLDKDLNDTVFSPNSYMILLNSFKAPYLTFYEGFSLACINNNASIKKPSNETLSVYKCFLRRFRKQCKRKCFKSHFKSGSFTLLCEKCKSYLKLRMELEKNNDDLDFYFPRKEKLSLRYLEKLTTIENINGMRIQLKTPYISFNLDYYILFHILKSAFNKWLAYQEKKHMTDELFNLCFIANSIGSNKLIIRSYKIAEAI